MKTIERKSAGVNASHLDETKLQKVSRRGGKTETLPQFVRDYLASPPLHFRQGCAVLAFLQHPNLSSFLAAFPHFDSQQTFPRVRKSYE
jgi:hypothetical protein